MAPSGPLPGAKLPVIELPLVGGGTASLSALAPGRAAKLVVLYRGQFCPFCRVRAARGAAQQRVRDGLRCGVALPYLQHI